MSLGKRQGTLWKEWQVITGLMFRDKQPQTVTFTSLAFGKSQSTHREWMETQEEIYLTFRHCLAHRGTRVSTPLTWINRSCDSSEPILSQFRLRTCANKVETLCLAPCLKIDHHVGRPGGPLVEMHNTEFYPLNAWPSLQGTVRQSGVKIWAEHDGNYRKEK